MKKIISVIIVVYGCSTTNYNKYKKDEGKKYFISKIDSINNYYLIYAETDDSIFKIVSEKNNVLKNCDVIKLENSYNLSLISYRESALKVFGKNTIPLTIQGFGVDENTVIKLEPEKGILDIHFTTNLEGLCLKK